MKSAYMFKRLAQSHAKNGYYPTDSETVLRVSNYLKIKNDGNTLALDPCCGEGSALGLLSDALKIPNSNCYGVELSESRAYEAKKHFGKVIHGDFFNSLIEQRVFSLLFLNPPYGDIPSDTTLVGTNEKRFEIAFIKRAIHSLSYNGICVYIIPKYEFRKQLCEYLAKYLTDVELFEAVDKQFQQVVLIGRKVKKHKKDHELLKRLLSVPEIELQTIPEEADTFYKVPSASHHKIKFKYASFVPKQAYEELEANDGMLWGDFDGLFKSPSVSYPCPVRKPTPWHLAILLASGAVNGVVESKDGRIFLIKGTTIKVQDVSKEVEVTLTESDEEMVTQVSRSKDRFVSKIIALDFTPNSETYGKCLTIT